MGGMRALLLGTILATAAASAAAEPVEHCRNRFTVFDRTVAAAEVGDAEARRIDGFSYLRVDRYSASLRRDLDTPEAFDLWVDRLADLDRAARVVEQANLPRAERHGLDAYLGGKLDTCRDLLIATDLATPEARAELVRRAGVADNYAPALRVAGLFPVTALPVALGFERWLDANLPAFDQPPLRAAARGTLARWSPGPKVAAPRLKDTDTDAFGHPRLDAATLDALASAHAPVFLIETASDADVPGRPQPGSPPGVDPTEPEVFVRTAWQRGPDGPLLQLIYSIWFDARPPEGPRDLLAGALDGVLWRVTLDRDGEVLLYDTIHACGCYHLAFPVPPTRRVPVPADETIEEALVVPQDAPPLAASERLAVRLAAGNHYVSGLAAVPVTAGAEENYRLVTDWDVPDRALRSIAMPDGGRRSLYGGDGLVAGSERGERFLLWPMGVISPGAMRQWGHHATAFVGRRHFDDPDLVSRYFMRPARLP